MAILTTVHHIAINSGEVISINCPCCKSANMKQDKKNSEYWMCDNGHIFYLDIYESSARSLNIRLKFLG